MRLILVSPTSNTNYSVIGTSSFGCTSSKSTSVTVETISSVSNKTICLGESTTLSASGGASSYLWSPGTITGSSITVSPELFNNWMYFSKICYSNSSTNSWNSEYSFK